MTDYRSQRLTKIPIHFFATHAQRLEALKLAGADIIHLDIGSPDLPPPDVAVETLITSARNPHHHGYQPHNFSRAYRKAWADFYLRNFQVSLDPEREIVPLIGSKEGIFHLMQAVVDPGDRVFVPDPGYITYTRGVQLAGGIPEALKLDPTNGYYPILEEIPRTALKNARVLWLNYPHNPTSAAATLDFFYQAVDFARRHRLLICHDAAYTQICFDGYQAPSILQIPGAQGVAVEFNTLSKSHAMAGWRVGMLAGNPAVVSALYALKTNADSGHFYPIIEAATAALAVGQEWFSARNELYRQRRDTLLETFAHLGWNAYRAPAGLYVWAQIPPFAENAQQFTSLILEKTHISVTPGSVFGQQDRYVRFSITAATRQVQAAAARLREWIDHEY
jgi:LL-diaminopimelate aminotransferase